MNTERVYDVQDISADTGLVTILPAPFISGSHPAAGEVESIELFRIRISTNQDDLFGQHLATIRWFDGIGNQELNLAIAATPENYSEQSVDIWRDQHEDVTIRVQPLVAGGSIDARVIRAW